VIRGASVVPIAEMIIVLGLLVSAVGANGKTLELTTSKPRRIEQIREKLRPFPAIIPIEIENMERIAPNLDFTAVEEFDLLVRSIKPGDSVVIGPRTYHIVGYLGGDSATRVFELTDGRVLRLPHDNSFHLMKTYLSQYSPYVAAGLPIVKIYLDESNPYAAVVDKITGLVVLDTFLRSLVGRPPERFTARENSMLDALVELEARSAVFRRMDDVHLGQVGFDTLQRRWIIFDWCNRPELAKSVDDPSPIFDGYIKGYFGSVISAKLEHKIRAAVRQRRIQTLMCEPLLTK